MQPTGLENYVVLDLVGEGSFGKVRTCLAERPSNTVRCSPVPCQQPFSESVCTVHLDDAAGRAGRRALHQSSCCCTRRGQQSALQTSITAAAGHNAPSQPC